MLREGEELFRLKAKDSTNTDEDELAANRFNWEIKKVSKSNMRFELQKRNLTGFKTQLDKTGNKHVVT